jgi:hypothetical protein
LEILAQQDLLALIVRLQAQQVQLVRKAFKEMSALLVHKVFRATKAFRASKVLQGQLDHKAFRVFKA